MTNDLKMKALVTTLVLVLFLPGPIGSNPADTYYKPYDPYAITAKPKLPYATSTLLPSYTQSKPKPKQNCTVKDEIIRAEICTPAFKTDCTTEEVTIKKLTTAEYCFDLAKTECTETEETIDNEVCTYEYKGQDNEASAKTVKVNFAKTCSLQIVTVCDPAHHLHNTRGYNADYNQGYYQYHQPHSYGKGAYCKDVEQETCYNTPEVEPMDVPVTLTFPVPEKKCESRPIKLPRVSCLVKTEKKCITVPEVMDDVQVVEKCQPIVGSPVCQKVELILPKQICQDIIYGYAHKPSSYEH